MALAFLLYFSVSIGVILGFYFSEYEISIPNLLLIGIVWPILITGVGWVFARKKMGHQYSEENDGP